MNYDLEERTAKFGEEAIIFCKTIKYNEINRPLISRLIRSATSIGANYMEANQGCSKKISKTKLEFVKKKRMNPSIGLGWWRSRIKTKREDAENYRRKCMN